MGSLTDELQRREAVARVEAEELRGRVAELAERLAGVEERLSRLVRPARGCSGCQPATGSPAGGRGYIISSVVGSRTVFSSV